MKKLSIKLVALVVSSLIFYGCSEKKEQEEGFGLKYEQYQLSNGLNVILHEDKSDPIVAMATVVQVGSNREKPGRTGFAHFFEHMSFNDSENVPKGANRKMIPELGGTRNGGTWSDGTYYYEVVPKDAFDKLLWIDSDRLGFMINTVDQGTLEREKQVVKNEKRQRVDNRPYGHTQHVIKKNLYPKDHPYNWTVIGDLEDLQAATLEDVKEFYNTYYVPSNATLVIAGDIDIEATKVKVEKWFGEIAAGPEVEAMKPRPVSITESKKLYHLDNFAKLPEIRLTFPTVEQYHEDAYALKALGTLLSSGKNAALYKTIVDTKKIASGVSSFHRAEEIAGTFTILVRANPGVKLDEVYGAIMSSLDNFALEGFTDDQLTKIKAEAETSFYYSIESILDKALQLGIYNEYAGSPDFIKQDIANITAVQRKDVMRVFKKYIHHKPAIVTSFVPKDAPELIVSGSEKANVIEEVITQGAEKQFEENDEIVFKKTVTKHDRSEPALTELPALSTPDVWESNTANGIRILGIEQHELPVVNFSITITGGQSLDQKDKLGTAYLMAQLMNEGTLTKTPQQLEEAIGLLGASLRISGGRESIVIRGNTLAKNFNASIALVNEMLLQPRWDESEFERLKIRRLTSIKQSKGDANSVASQAFLKLLYGTEHLAGAPIGGTIDTVEAIELADLKAFYNANISPKNATLHIVGDIKRQEVEKSMQQLLSWQGEAVSIPEQPSVENVKEPKLFFIDLPKAKQSVIYVGKAVVAGDNNNFYPIEFANMRLGGGISARLTQTLRIEKGYTYGAYSYIASSSFQSPFIASSQVRTNVTLESLEIFKQLIGQYQQTFTLEDLAVAKNMTIKSNSRRFETLNSLLGMLENISRFDKPKNYVEQEQNFVINAQLIDVHNAIENFLDEQEMIYLVVGDAATQLKRMSELGYGEPIMLDMDGNRI